MKSYVFRVVIEDDVTEGGEKAYHAFCPVLKGCHTWGRTYEEALANIREAIELYVADLRGVAGDFGAELAKEQLGKRGGGNPRCRFTSGGALENVAGVVKVKSLRASKISVAGTRRNELFVLAGKIRRIFDGQSFFPIGPIAIFDAQRHGSADSFAVAHSGEDLGFIFLNFLTATPPVSKLAAMEFMIDEINIDGKRRGQSRDEGKQSLSVRFTGGVEAKHGQ